MNLETWKDLDQNVSNFGDFCIQLSWADLVIDRHNSQVRQAGHKLSMVPRFTETLKKIEVEVLSDIKQFWIVTQNYCFFWTQLMYCQMNFAASLESTLTMSSYVLHPV